MIAKNSRVSIELTDLELMEILKKHYPENVNIQNLTVDHICRDVGTTNDGVAFGFELD